MRLLDVADVERGNGTWYTGWESDSRVCGVELALVDACDPEEKGALIGDADTGPGTYSTLPFAIVAKLRRPVNCLRDDDESWLAKQLKAAEEYAVGHAMVVEAVPGTESWVGSDAVTEVPYTAASPVDADALVTAIIDARELWFKKVLGEAPIIHISPHVAHIVANAGIIKINGCDPSKEDHVCSIWGDKVVINAGYNTGGPDVFFTGDIKVYLSDVDSMGLLVGNRNNRTELSANIIAVLDVDPCTIVRVGPVAAGSYNPNVIVVSINGLTVTMRAQNTPEGEAVSYDWGDGTAAESVPDETDAVHTYAAAGDYVVVISTSDGSESTRAVSVGAVVAAG